MFDLLWLFFERRNDCLYKEIVKSIMRKNLFSINWIIYLNLHGQWTTWKSILSYIQIENQRLSKLSKTNWAAQIFSCLIVFTMAVYQRTKNEEKSVFYTHYPSFLQKLSSIQNIYHKPRNNIVEWLHWKRKGFFHSILHTIRVGIRKRDYLI
jgi:hypothetical protein